jgi:hypothetical protein
VCARQVGGVASSFPKALETRTGPLPHLSQPLLLAAPCNVPPTRSLVLGFPSRNLAQPGTTKQQGHCEDEHTHFPGAVEGMQPFYESHSEARTHPPISLSQSHTHCPQNLIYLEPMDGALFNNWVFAHVLELR